MVGEYQRILVAIDGSDNARLAFKHAVEVAKRNNAKLFVLQVINDQSGSYSPFSYGEVIQQEEARASESMAKYLGFADDHGLKNIEEIIRLGNPKQTIARLIPEEYKIDLILIGATGKGVVNRLVVGSTTSFVVQHARCNVLVVKNKD